MSYDILKALIEGDDEVHLYKIRLAGMLKRMSKHTEKKTRIVRKCMVLKLFQLFLYYYFYFFASSSIID